MARILVAEDERDIRDLIVFTLTFGGYEVLQAKDGEEALSLVDSEPVSLVVLDVIMPKMNGFQVCRKIKTSERHSAIKVILLTSKSQEADKFWGKKQGADLYMTKPFQVEDFLSNVASLV